MTAEQKGLRKPFEPLRVDESPAANPAASVPAPFGDPPQARRASGFPESPRRRTCRSSIGITSIASSGAADASAGHSRCCFTAPTSPNGWPRWESLSSMALCCRRSAKALTWLITAREFDCDYEWALSEHAAQKAGIPDALVRTIGRREPLAGLNDEQQVLADFCHQLLRGNHHVRDATYRAAVAKFGVPGTVRVAATIGYFAMHAMVLNAFEVNPEERRRSPYSNSSSTRSNRTTSAAKTIQIRKAQRGIVDRRPDDGHRQDVESALDRRGRRNAQRRLRRAPAECGAESERPREDLSRQSELRRDHRRALPTAASPRCPKRRTWSASSCPTARCSRCCRNATKRRRARP